MAVRDKDIERAELDAISNEDHIKYLEQQKKISLQLRDRDGWENPAFAKELDDSFCQNLEGRIEYVKKFIESLMR